VRGEVVAKCKGVPELQTSKNDKAKAFDIRGYGVGSKMQDKRLFLELRKAASELRHNQKVDPLVFEIVELLEKRVVTRADFWLDAEEHEVADLILRHLISVRTHKILRPKPIDFSRKVFRAPWLRGKLRSRHPPA
jgi:hypothetical protein